MSFKRSDDDDFDWPDRFDEGYGDPFEPPDSLPDDIPDGDGWITEEDDDEELDDEPWPDDEDDDQGIDAVEVFDPTD